MTESVEDFKKRLEDEYSFRALGPIDVDGVRAYNKGHLVPATNVEEHGYLDAGLVERIAAADDDSAAATPPPAADAATQLKSLASAPPPTPNPPVTPPAAGAEKKD